VPSKSRPQPAGEQGIAAKKIVVEEISHMAGCVAGNEENSSLQLPDINFIAFIDAAGEAMNSRAVAPVAVDLGFVLGENALIAARMVAMMMGIENRFERDFFLLDFIESRFGFRGVDDGRGFALFTNQQISVVVAQHWNLENFHKRFSSRYDRIGLGLILVSCRALFKCASPF
jgi:hypothetical protein